MIAEHFRGATVIKAFNAILEKDLLVAYALPHGAKRALPIAGDDAAAIAVVTALQADFGFHTIDAGSLTESWRFERAKPAYCIPLTRDALITALPRQNGMRSFRKGRGGDSNSFSSRALTCGTPLHAGYAAPL